jgi:hypothetical protein
MKTKLTALLGTLIFVSSIGSTSLLAQGQKKVQAKPFLIQGKLPHLTMMVKVFWDDEDVAFTESQKEKLLLIRQETMSGAKALGKQINPLEASIVKRTLAGEKPESLKADVEKLASLRAKATIIHIECIYKTRAVLTQDQHDIIE